MKSIYILLFATISFSGFAQQFKIQNLPYYDQKWLHFGFSVGFNTMDFTIHQENSFLLSDTIYRIENNRNPGFNLGPIVNVRLGKYFDARALIILSFGQRDLVYSEMDDNSRNRSDLYSRKMKIESTYIELPIFLKYKAERINNYRPYIIVGISTKYDLAAQKKIKDEEMPKIRLNPIDYFYELGFGIDFYLPYFKLSTELKYSQGITNVVKYDNTSYTSTIKKMTSKMWVLSFHFE